MQHPVTNHGKTFMTVGNAVIPPGETRMVEAHLVPPDQQPEAVEATTPPPADAIAELAKANVGKIIAAIPTLTLFDLDELDAYEQSGKNRKSVLEAIALERLGREPADAGATTDAATEGGE